MKSKNKNNDHYQLIDDNDSKQDTFSEIRREWMVLFSFTTKAQLVLLMPALLCACISGTMDPAMAIFLGRFVGSLSEYGGGKINGDTMIATSLTSVYGLILIGGLTWILKGGFFCLWVIYGETQAKTVRDLLFEALLQKDVAWYEAHSNGISSLLLRSQTHIRELQIGISQPLGFVCMCVVQALASIGVAFFYSWKLTLIVLSAAPVMIFVISLVQKGLPIAREAEENALNISTAIAANALSNIILVKCSNTQELECGRYRRSLLMMAEHYCRQACINAVEIGLSRFGSTAVVIAGVVYGIVLVHQDKATIANILTAFWSCLAAANALEDILPHLLVLRKSCTAVIVLRSLLEHVTRPGGIGNPQEPLCPDELDGEVEFRNVSFVYPSHPSRFVLDNITCSFPAGRFTFLVGKSGSGKSTISNLLLKFYKAQSGSISIDGYDIQQLNTCWLRNNITLVQQQSHLFEGTVYENVVLCQPGNARILPDRIEESLKFATLSQSMNELPAGRNTRVGLGGSGLSGGQRQRVAIARARLRDTPIVILDESTSALDTPSRDAVMQNIRAWCKDKTTIVITHDLTQVTASDFLYILKEGQVVAKGYRNAVIGSLKDEGLLGISTEMDDNYKHNPQQPHIKDGPQPILQHSSRPWHDSRHRSRLGRQDSLDQILSSYRNAYKVEDGELPNQTTPIKTTNSTHDILSRISPLVSSFRSDNEGIRFSQSLRPISRSIRPISMHHAIAMRKLYKQLDENENTQIGSESDDSSGTNPSAFNSTGSSVKQDSLTQHTNNRLWILMKIFGTIWSKLSSTEKSCLLLGVLATVVHAVCPPIFSYLLTKLFTTMYTQEGWQKSARTFSLSLIGIAVIDGTTAFLLHYVLEAIGQSWINALRKDLLERIMDLPKAWFDESHNNPSRICSILDRNANETRNLLGRFAAPILVVITMMAGTYIWAFTQCWKITLIGLSSAPLMYATTELFARVSSHWETLTNDQASTVIAIFTETFSDIRTLRALCLESHFHQKHAKATSRAFAVGLRRAVFSGVLFGLSDAMLIFVIAALFSYGAVLARSGSYSVESIMMVFTLLLFSMTTATSIIAYIPQLSSSVDSASRLLSLSTLSIDSHETKGSVEFDKSNSCISTGPIKFINQTFHYPSYPEVAALHNASFTIPQNSYTAIVGTSGSGKSTIASLLLGLYSPQAPEPRGTNTNTTTIDPKILVSNHDIRTLSLPRLRAMTGYVSQTPCLLPGTVRENILYGLPNVHNDTVLLHAAAKSASIHNFIQTLPDGYNTLIGEGGQPLSGGQAQRIAIARALARDPRILILDEATSALDWSNMDLIRRSLLDSVRAQNRTVIVITHAREMVEDADHVVVLEKGRVVEEGGVEDLLRGRGWLWRMMRSGAGGVPGDDDSGRDDPGEGPSGIRR